MIRICKKTDLQTIYEIINDAALAYKGVIPEDCWHEPYMPMEELQSEIESGVVFWGYEQEDKLVGVMGIQPVKDVILIRHAYVRTKMRNQGIGGQLLTFLYNQTKGPVLIGTWADAVWAVRFYQKHGFQLVSAEKRMGLLNKYWQAPERQFEVSVVLGDPRWVELQEVKV